MPAGSPQEQASQKPNSDYGAGGHSVTQNDTAGAELHGTVYDSTGTLRHDETNTFTTTERLGATDNEKRAAYEALEKLKVAAGVIRTAALWLKFGVAAVAQPWRRSVLAPAEVDSFSLGGVVLHGGEAAASVASIAEGLVGAQAAGAPEVALARFDFHGIWALLGNFRFRHRHRGFSLSG
jgi:hypothetical protein